MKFTQNWLKEYLDTRAKPAALGDALTGLGFELEALAEPAAALTDFMVGTVESVRAHPNADRLRLATVRTRKSTHEVVCGAPNLRKGMKAVFAPLGARIPQSGERLREAEIRGVKSAGMLCSAAELGVGEAADGIVELAAATSLQKNVASALGADDAVFEVNVLPHRGDALSVYGLARELAAAGLGRLQPLGLPRLARGAQAQTKVTIEKNARAACAYFGLVELRGCKIVDSPPWLQQRLRAVGITPTSAPVDYTNYVALTFGHPMHVYDGDKIDGDICVRLAKKSERVAGLDGQTYELAGEDCVIADAKRALGIGGVMGGAASACQKTSRNLVLEAAWFAPAAIARTGQRLNCTSESRLRYERGVDATLTQGALAWVARALAEACGGTLSAPQSAGKMVARQSGGAFDPAKIAALAGCQVPLAQAKRTLSRLGFRVSVNKKSWRVRAPSWRMDISSQSDALAAELTEEVLRFHGVEKIKPAPLPPPSEDLPVRRPPALARRTVAQRLLAARGCSEQIAWSFISARQAADFGNSTPRHLANPISESLACLRHSLLPNLAAAVRANLKRHTEWLHPLHLFEVGQVFGEKNSQNDMAASLRLPKGPRHWQHKEPPPHASVFAAKADALALLAALGVQPSALSLAARAPAYYHPQAAAGLMLGKVCVGWFGELHPALAKKEDLPAATSAMELFLDRLPTQATSRAAYQVTDYPLVRRDFAFYCDAHVRAEDLVAAARKAAPAMIAAAQVFDVFVDADGKKSLALEIVLAPQAGTLAEQEIVQLSDTIAAAVREATGAVLREA